MKIHNAHGKKMSNQQLHVAQQQQQQPMQPPPPQQPPPQYQYQYAAPSQGEAMILTQLNSISTGLVAIDGRIEVLNMKGEATAKSLEAISALSVSTAKNLEGLTRDVTGLNTTVGGLTTSVSNLTTTVNGLGTTVGGLSTTATGLTEGLKTLAAKVDKSDATLSAVIDNLPSDFEKWALRAGAGAGVIAVGVVVYDKLSAS